MRSFIRGNSVGEIRDNVQNKKRFDQIQVRKRTKRINNFIND